MEQERQVEDNIRDHLEKSDISMTDIAKKIRVSRPQLYRWLSGEQPMPWPRIEAIARVLDVHPATLMYNMAVDGDTLTKVLTVMSERMKTLGIELAPEHVSRIATMLYTEVVRDRRELTTDRVEEVLKVIQPAAATG